MFKKVRCLTRPTQARQDAPFHGQGLSPFDPRSVLIVRERERREEQQVCEPEGSAKWRERRWRLFSTFPNWPVVLGAGPMAHGKQRK